MVVELIMPERSYRSAFHIPSEPTITKFHLSWGENGYAVASTTPTRHLSRVAPLDIPLDIFIRRSPPAEAPLGREV